MRRIDGFLREGAARRFVARATFARRFGACAAVASTALAMPAIAAAAPAAAATARYTMRDFDRVPKVDAHMHLHVADAAFARFAQRHRFQVFTINVDYPDFPPIDVQQRAAQALRAAAPRTVGWAATFPVDRSAEAGWAASTVARIDAALAQGAAGVKIWKNVGMDLRDAAAPGQTQGPLVMVDDARFTPVFDALAQRGVPLLGHQGEPHNCWLPLAEMTVKNDREYFAAHPQYHMALHPEFPSYDAQMAARDRMVARHRNLPFIGMHLASLEWSVDRLAAFLDANPQSVVDVAARIGQLQHQAQQDPAKVRAFVVKYQDRLLYGSDASQPLGQDGRAFGRELLPVWRAHWRWFVTGDTFRVPELDAPVRGLALPRAVVDKLYRTNAHKALARAWR